MGSAVPYFTNTQDARELSYALAPIFNAEMKELVAAGATFLQSEDLGRSGPENPDRPSLARGACRQG